ncbi:MAG: hypothetical protein JRC90_07800 [Deltaproteobacteria bacterium]|nr:hypothetical protein [Deltaproteobacteria bacterium]
MKIHDKTIVCYLDILGYTNIVKAHYDNIELIKELESLMVGSTSGFIQKARKHLFPDTIYEDYSKQIIDLLNIKFISDSIIFTLPLDNIPFSHENYTEKETESNCIMMLLYFISMFCTLFISHTGYCVRGGISIGKHYENNFNEEKSLFVFSQAYIKAYQLERKANTPRVLVDKVLYDYLAKIHFPKLDKFFFQDFQDISRSICFDFYAHLIKDTYEAKQVLEEIKRGIVLNLQQNSGDTKILSKLKYFANYHNEKATKVIPGDRDAIIETS